jgi:hypothetical protein
MLETSECSDMEPGQTTITGWTSNTRMLITMSAIFWNSYEPRPNRVLGVDGSITGRAIEHSIARFVQESSQNAADL